METSKSHRVQVPGYRILDVRGVGAMATVYHAIQERLGREVALKVLHDGVAQDEDYRERFLREARAAARLNNENVVRAYEAGVHDGAYWLAMEYVQGEDLSERLDQEGSLTEEESIRIAVEVCRGLQVAAEHDMVHRDVKPENILLGDDGEVKLADLGLAKIHGDGSGSVTAEGISVGTVAFFSPEQCRGRRDLDIRSDLFALGGTLYAMISGDLPFGRGDNPPVTMKRILEEWPPDLDDETKFSPSIREAIKTLMAKRRSDRPADARGAAALLRDACDRLDESQVGHVAPTSDSTEDARSERELRRYRKRRGALGSANSPRFPAGALIAGLACLSVLFVGMTKLRRSQAAKQETASASRAEAEAQVRTPVATTRAPTTRAPAPPTTPAASVSAPLPSQRPGLRYDWRGAGQLEDWNLSGEGSTASVSAGRLHFAVRGGGRLELERTFEPPLEVDCDLRIEPPGASVWFTIEPAPGEGWASAGPALYAIERRRPSHLAGTPEASAGSHHVRLVFTGQEARGWLDGQERFRHTALTHGPLTLAFHAERGASVDVGPLMIRSGEEAR